MAIDRAPRALAVLLAGLTLCLLAPPQARAQPAAGLAISEVHLDPDAPAASFVELVQLGEQPVALEGFALTTAADYATALVTGEPDDAVLLALPADQTLAPGERLVVSGPDREAFEAAWGRAPDLTTAAPLNASLDDDAGLLVLVYWDGTSDLVSDADMLRWGSLGPAVDKSNLLVDGPDDDTLTSRYGTDTPIGQQEPAGALRGRTLARVGAELGEARRVDANGLDGHDETSELWARSFAPTRAATPGRPNRFAWRVSGLVLAPDGQPAAGAVVRNVMTGTATTTDADGRFTLDAVSVGTALLDIDGRDAEGNPLSTRVEVVVDDRDVEDVVADLSPGSTISGRVQLRDVLPPDLAGTRVAAPEAEASTLTDGDGDFLLGGLPERPVTIEVTRDGFAAQRVTIDPATLDRLELELRPATTWRVAVSLKSGGGALPAGTRVELLPTDQTDAPLVVTTPSAGEPRVTLTGVPDARYRLRVEAPDFEVVELGPFEVDQDLSVVVELVPIVLDVDGQRTVSCTAVVGVSDASSPRMVWPLLVVALVGWCGWRRRRTGLSASARRNT